MRHRCCQKRGLIGENRRTDEIPPPQVGMNSDFPKINFNGHLMHRHSRIAIMTSNTFSIQVPDF